MIGETMGGTRPPKQWHFRKRPKLLILLGLPGSGKSSIADILREEGWVHISKQRYSTAIKREIACWRSIRKGSNVVIDKGNFDPRQRMPWLLMADEVLGGRQNYDSIALHVITSRRQVRKHALEDQPHFTHYADRDKIIKRVERNWIGLHEVEGFAHCFKVDGPEESAAFLDALLALDEAGKQAAAEAMAAAETMGTAVARVPSHAARPSNVAEASTAAGRADAVSMHAEKSAAHATQQPSVGAAAAPTAGGAAGDSTQAPLPADSTASPTEHHAGAPARPGAASSTAPAADATEATEAASAAASGPAAEATAQGSTGSGVEHPAMLEPVWPVHALEPHQREALDRLQVKPAKDSSRWCHAMQQGMEAMKRQLLLTTSLLAPELSDLSHTTVRSRTRQRVLVLTGPPGSGKSTLSRWLRSSGWQHVTQNDMRTRWRCEKAVRRALLRGYDVVVDRCNPTPEQRCNWLVLADEVLGGRDSYDSMLLHLHIPIAECAKRCIDPTGREGLAKGLLQKFEHDWVDVHAVEGFKECFAVKGDDDIRMLKEIFSAADLRAASGLPPLPLPPPGMRRPDQLAILRVRPQQSDQWTRQQQSQMEARHRARLRAWFNHEEQAPRGRFFMTDKPQNGQQSQGKTPEPRTTRTKYRPSPRQQLQAASGRGSDSGSDSSPGPEGGGSIAEHRDAVASAGGGTGARTRAGVRFSRGDRTTAASSSDTRASDSELTTASSSIAYPDVPAKGGVCEGSQGTNSRNATLGEKQHSGSTEQHSDGDRALQQHSFGNGAVGHGRGAVRGFSDRDSVMGDGGVREARVPQLVARIASIARSCDSGGGSHVHTFSPATRESQQITRTVRVSASGSCGGGCSGLRRARCTASPPSLLRADLRRAASRSAGLAMRPAPAKLCCL